MSQKGYSVKGYGETPQASLHDRIVHNNRFGFGPHNNPYDTTPEHIKQMMQDNKPDREINAAIKKHRKDRDNRNVQSHREKARKAMNMSEETLLELSHKTLKNYVEKSCRDASHHSMHAGLHMAAGDKKGAKHHAKKADKRHAGAKKALGKLEELSSMTLRKYIDRNLDSMAAGSDKKPADKTNRLIKRSGGLGKAMKKLTRKGLHEAKKENKYHSVFHQHDGRWMHYFDADDAYDAGEEVNSIRRMGGKAKVIRVPRDQAHWNKMSGDEIHAFVTKHLKEEDLQELSVDTLMSYAKKADDHKKFLLGKTVDKLRRGERPSTSSDRIVRNRIDGSELAKKKINQKLGLKEEDLQELSRHVMTQYLDQAWKHQSDLRRMNDEINDKIADHQDDNSPIPNYLFRNKKFALDRATRRKKGIKLASKRMADKSGGNVGSQTEPKNYLRKRLKFRVVNEAEKKTGVSDQPPGAPKHAYSRVAVNKAIESSNRSGRKISKREAALIHRLLSGGRKSIDESSKEKKRKFLTAVGDVEKQSRAAPNFYWSSHHHPNDVANAKQKHARRVDLAKKVYKRYKSIDEERNHGDFRYDVNKEHTPASKLGLHKEVDKKTGHWKMKRKSVNEVSDELMKRAAKKAAQKRDAAKAKGDDVKHAQYYSQTNRLMLKRYFRDKKKENK